MQAFGVVEAGGAHGHIQRQQVFVGRVLLGRVGGEGAVGQQITSWVAGASSACPRNRRRSWVNEPEPMMSTPSVRNAASARPRAT